MFAKKLTTTSLNAARGPVAVTLQLRTETLHVLQDSDLSRVVGGTAKRTV